jgi:hypothetical protein
MEIAVRNLTLLLIVSFLTTGCGLGLGAERVVRGREIDLAVFESKLRSGMSPAEIEEAFGPPFQRKIVGDGEEWRYLEVRTLQACRLVVLFIPLGPAPKRRTEVRLELGPSGLSGAWLEVNPGDDGKPVRRPLLSAPAYTSAIRNPNAFAPVINRSS